MKRACSFILSVLLLIQLLGVCVLSGAVPGEVTPTVSVGGNFMVALRSDGKAVAWGGNASGQLGDGSRIDSSVPVAVAMPDGVAFSSVSAGQDHVLAVGSDGSAYSWGANDYGQLGYDTQASYRTAPERIAAFEGETVLAVAAGNTFSLALLSDGTVWAWGNNRYRLLGDDSPLLFQSSTPVQCGGALEGAFVCKIFAGDTTAAAITGDGSLYLWGNNDSAQLGVAAFSGGALPMRCPIVTSCKAVALGSKHTTVLLQDGSVKSMGTNSRGQFGNGEQDDSAYIALIPASGLGEVSAYSLGSGGEHALLLDSYGSVFAWGNHRDGQLGLGEASDVVKVPTAISFPEDTVIVGISARGKNGAAVAQGGCVYTWGDNYYGQLGCDSDALSASSPVRVAGQGGNGFLTLGVGPTTVVYGAQVTAIANVPTPTYTVYIPATMDLGTLSQKTERDEDRYAARQMTVSVSDVHYLFGEQEIVVTATPSGDEFVLLDGTHRLTYEMYGEADPDTPLTTGGVVARFLQDGDATLRIRVDQSQIRRNGTYTGTVTFSVSLGELH